MFKTTATYAALLKDEHGGARQFGYVGGDTAADMLANSSAPELLVFVMVEDR